MKNILKSLQYGLLDYIEGDENPEYSKDDVTSCIKLLLEFMSEIEAAEQSSERATDLVGKLVLALNSLNEDCHGCLLASDEFEEITEFIEKVMFSEHIKPETDISQLWRV